jgi:pimeloyl-ACP methyl ester carboxylesterase
MAGPLVLAQDASFYVGGDYVDTPDGPIVQGAMYVHALVPAEPSHPYPVVMIHGINGTGVTYEGTPDGREGWAQHFVRAGYAVYVCDQPARGRSPYRPDLDGPLFPRMNTAGADGVAIYTAPAPDAYPQAKHHAQWPGSGRRGDPAFDAFMRGRTDSLPTPGGASERATKAAGAALLDRIGPAVLLTHSQSGAFGWQIADARPGLVRGIVAIEPALAPTVPPMGPGVPPYGITSTPITYDPPVATPDDIAHVTQPPETPDVFACWLQAEPARRLPNLIGIPIAIVIAEASPLARSSHCVARYLAQAGVVNDCIRLEDAGIHGNNHLPMLERNSDEIAAFLQRWLTERGL